MDLTYNTTLVLTALSRGARYGLEVMDHTGLSSGTVYPVLRRLEADGLVGAEWEDENAARRDQRPARRYYVLLPEGREALERGLARVREQQRALGLVPDGTGRG